MMMRYIVCAAFGLLSLHGVQASSQSFLKIREARLTTLPGEKDCLAVQVASIQIGAVLAGDAGAVQGIESAIGDHVPVALEVASKLLDMVVINGKTGRAATSTGYAQNLKFFAASSKLVMALLILAQAKKEDFLARQTKAKNLLRFISGNYETPGGQRFPWDEKPGEVLASTDF